MSAAALMAEARAAAQAKLESRHPGQATLLGTTCAAVLVIGPGTEIVDFAGRLATESISARIRAGLLPSQPSPGDRIVDVATGRGYEIVSVRRDGAVWTIRGAVFPGA